MGSCIILNYGCILFESVHLLDWKITCLKLNNFHVDSSTSWFTPQLLWIWWILEFFGFFRYIYLYRQYSVAGFSRSEDDFLKVFNTSIQGQSPGSLWSSWSSCSSWYIIMVDVYGFWTTLPVICTSLKSLNYHQLYYISMHLREHIRVYIFWIVLSSRASLKSNILHLSSLKRNFKIDTAFWRRHVKRFKSLEMTEK